MADKVQTSVSFPEPIAKELENRKKVTGQPKAAIIQRAVAQELGVVE